MTATKWDRGCAALNRKVNDLKLHHDHQIIYRTEGYAVTGYIGVGGHVLTVHVVTPQSGKVISQETVIRDLAAPAVIDFLTGGS